MERDSLLKAFEKQNQKVSDVSWVPPDAALSDEVKKDWESLEDYHPGNGFPVNVQFVEATATEASCIRIEVDGPPEAAALFSKVRFVPRFPNDLVSEPMSPEDLQLNESNWYLFNASIEQTDNGKNEVVLLWGNSRSELKELVASKWRW